MKIKRFDQIAPPIPSKCEYVMKIAFEQVHYAQQCSCEYGFDIKRSVP